MKRKLFLTAIVMVVFNVLTFAQQTTVSGTVTSASDGLSLPGASVVLKGTTIGTVTDFDGKYTLSFDAVENPVLVFSFIGYSSQELPVNGQSTIDIALSQDISDLDEVVVVGYGVQKKSLVTGAISKLSSDDLVATQPQRVEQAIQGKVSGVSVASESGSPGAGLTIRVRGASSNANSDPLFIVDGMKTSGIDYLDPSDIESIEILKDAASAAIYGAEGGNGVVLVTTKKGKAGQAQVTYSTYYGQQFYIDKLELMDADQYVKYYQDAVTYEKQAVGYKKEWDEEKIQNSIATTIANEGLPAIGQSPSYRTNWMDEVTSAAPILSHNIGLSGGNEKSLYSSSVNYFKQKGITGGDRSEFNRFTARLNMEHKATDYLKVGINATYSHRERKALGENNEFGGAYGNALMIDPITPVYYPNYDSIPDVYRGIGYDDALAMDGDKYYGMSTHVKNEIINPLAQISNSNNNFMEEKIKAGAFIEISPIEGLVFKTSYDVDLATQLAENWNPRVFYHDLNKAEVSTSDQQNRRFFTWQFDNILSYSKTYGEHSASLMVGTHAEEYTGNELTGNGWDMIRESYAFSHPANAQFIPVPVNDSVSEPYLATQALGGFREDPRRIASVFGRFSYNYAEKYMLNVTIRNDRSSMLSPKENPDTKRPYYSGIFPSYSLGWVVSRESFWAVPFINFFKARYSFGKNGSLGALTPFQYVPLIGFDGNPYQSGTSTILNGATPEMLSNDALQWEATGMHNFGFDFRFLDSKFSSTIEYFIKTTENLLTEANTPGYVGNEPPQANLGTVVNKGLEFELSYKQYEGEFQYEIGGNVSFLKNEVTDYADRTDNGANLGVGGPVTRIEEGQPLYFFYGYKTDGVWKDWTDIETNNTYIDEEGEEQNIQRNPIPGDIKIVDVNGDGRISTDDRTYIGSPFADAVFGLNFSGNYKGFDFSMNMSASIGNEVYFGVYRSDLGKVNHPTFFQENAWSPENPDADFFRPTIASGWNFEHNDMFVENGSYLKFKNLQIGYTLPTDLTKKAQISKVRVYVSTNNLFTLTKYHGSDPEMGNTGGISSYGIDRGFYPQARQFLAGLNVTF